MSGLQQTCQKIAQDVVDALTDMAGAAGHAGLRGALTGAAGRGSNAYTAMSAALGHTSDGLASSAQTYLSADQKSASQASAVARSLFIGRLRA
jgi:hypothetical protein